MGDHSVDKKMDVARKARDDFRANRLQRKEVDRCRKIAKGELKRRLHIWSHFFSLYQISDGAVLIRDQIAKLETELQKKRAERKEGYIDPRTERFIAASENKMRNLLRTHPDEKIRKACFDALEKLPLGSLDDYIRIVKLRNKFAKVIGYEDFYDYKIRIDEGMSKEELFSIFESLYEKTKFGLRNIRRLEKKQPGLRRPWNFSYMMSGSLVKEEDQYFRFENVLSYWGRSFAALGIHYNKGTLRLDLLDREGKWNNGFCHYPDLVRFKNGRWLPGSSNFTSNAIPSQVGSGLNGIHTVFHEAGHAADRLNSKQKDVCINTEYPPGTVSWAETHSMFMDSIPDSIEWRVRYAKIREVIHIHLNYLKEEHANCILFVRLR